MAADNDWLGRVVKWVLIVVLAIVAFKLASWLAGALMGVVFFLLFTVAPLALLGWLLVKVYRFFRRDDDYRPA